MVVSVTLSPNVGRRLLVGVDGKDRAQRTMLMMTRAVVGTNDVDGVAST